MSQPVETLTYAGIVWRRYPDARHETQRAYYSGRWGGRKTHLHRVVYALEVGPIPAGHDVHHKDGNTLNNVATNLEPLPAPDHSRLHALGRIPQRYSCAECARDFLSRHTRPAVHCSTKCRNAARVVHGKIRTLRCQWCKKKFVTESNRTKCCSISCGKSLTWSRKPKRMADCVICGATFKPDRLASMCCSRSCAVALGHRSRRR